MCPRSAALAVLLAATGAGASSVTNEIISTSTQASQANPRSGSFGNSLNGNLDLNSDFTVRAGLLLTFEGQTEAASRAQFGDSGSLVTLITAGVDWAATDELTVSLHLEGSPRSTQFAGTPVTLRQANGSDLSGDARVRSQTSEIGGGLDLAWDSSGTSDLEWSFDGGVSWSHYDVNQNITRVLAGGTSLTAQQLRQQTVAYCQSHPRVRNCGRALLAALSGSPVQQDFARISGSATATISRDTDLTLAGDYYAYPEDPSQVGFFGLAAAGRGVGLPVAPLRFLIQPEVQHRFGDFSVRVWVRAGEYVAGTGQSTAGLGTRLQYKLSKAWRAWASISGNRDVDESDAVTRTGTVTLGAGYRW